MITALFFDAAGTLIDTTEPVAETYARVLSSHGIDIPVNTLAARFPAAFAKAGDPDFSGLPDGDLAERAWWRSIVEACVDSRISDEPFEALFNHFAQPSAWTVLPEVIETLESARLMNLQTAVVSNFDARLHQVLAGLGLSPYFDLILTSGDARARKPSPEIFNQAMARLALQANEVRHVGDSPRYDGEGAKNAGIQPFILSPPERGLGQFLEEVRHELRK